MLLTAYLIDNKTVGVELESWDDSSLNGSPAFKAEDVVSDGYADISSITNWNNFGLLTGKDFKFIRGQIKNIRQAIGYENLTESEQIIANKYFASGVEYNNAQVTPEQQDYYCTYFYKPQMDESRRRRDLAITPYLMKKLYTGVLSKSVVDQLIDAATGWRTRYMRDGLEGVGYGDTVDGLINFVENSSEYAPFSIVGVDTVTKTFSVPDDNVSKFISGNKIRIHDSTGNDGAYTIVSASFDDTNTNVIVSESIPDSTVDGKIYINGLMFYSGITGTMQAEIYDVYVNGNYLGT